MLCDETKGIYIHSAYIIELQFPWEKVRTRTHSFGETGPSSTPRNQLPQEEMRSYQPAEAEEEAQVEMSREGWRT